MNVKVFGRFSDHSGDFLSVLTSFKPFLSVLNRKVELWSVLQRNGDVWSVLEHYQERVSVWGRLGEI